MPFFKTQSRKKQLSRRAGIAVPPLVHPPDPAREGRDSHPAPRRSPTAVCWGSSSPTAPRTAEIRPAGGSFICKAIIARGRDPRRRRESDLPADGFVISRAQQFGLNETKPLLLMKTPLMSRASKGGAAPLVGPWGSWAPGARPEGQRLYPTRTRRSLIIPNQRCDAPGANSPHVHPQPRAAGSVHLGQSCAEPSIMHWCLQKSDGANRLHAQPSHAAIPTAPTCKSQPAAHPLPHPHRLALQSRKQARTAKGRGEEQTEGGRQQTDEAVRQHSHPSPREGAASAEGGRVGTVGPPGIPCPSESISTPLPTPRGDFPRGSWDSPASSPASRPGRARGAGWA